MYHPPSKRVRFWRKLLVITVMALTVVLGVVVLMALTLGYGFNQKDGRLEQGGILQINTKPSGATVTINGTRFGSQTPTKLVSQPGDYSLVVERTGYQPWQKTVPIQAGNITWATYARLIPTALNPSTTLIYPATTASALPSPSSKRYAVLPAADKPVVSVAQLDSDSVKAKEYSLPTALYTAGDTPSRFALDTWSGDEKHLLLRHTYGANGATEWVLFNLEQPDESVNLNRMFGIATNMAEPLMASGDGSLIYALIDGSVRLLNLDDETLSRPLVDKVVEFRLYDNQYVAFVRSSDDDKQQVGYVRKDDKAPVIVKTLSANSAKAQPQFDIAKYYDRYYFLIANGTTAELVTSPSLPSDPTTKLKLTHIKTLQLTDPITDANLTDSGQFATVQDGSSFATFNLEIKQASLTKLEHGSSPLPQKLEYLDGYLLWGMHDGRLRTYEFDGTNQHDIMPLVPEFGATLSPGGKYLYGLAKQDNGEVALTRVQLLDLPTTQ